MTDTLQIRQFQTHILDSLSWMPITISFYIHFFYQPRRNTKCVITCKRKILLSKGLMSLDLIIFRMKIRYPQYCHLFINLFFLCFLCFNDLSQ